MTTPCTQEATIAVIDNNLGNIAKGIEEIKSSQKELFKTLDGNGSTGLITQTALNKAAISRAWYFIAAIILALLSAGVYNVIPS